MAANNTLSFYEISSLLTQLNINLTEEELDTQLAGIDFNTLYDDTENLLCQLTNEGELNAVHFILDKGAQPDLLSSAYHYYKGPALLYALRNNRSNTSIKVAMIQLLLDYKANASVEVEWHDEEKDATVKGQLIDYGLQLAFEQVEHMNDDTLDAPSRKSAKEDVEGLQAMLSLLQKSGIKISSSSEQKLKDLLAIKTKNDTQIDAKQFLSKAKEMLAVENRMYDLPSIAKEVCYTFLENEHFIPTKEWNQLFEHLVHISLTFKEVSLEVYDEDIKMEDDEGWLCQGWTEYSWLSELLEILSDEKTTQNEKWGEMVLLLMAEQDKYDVDLQYELEELLEKPWVQSHPSFNAITKKLQQ